MTERPLTSSHVECAGIGRVQECPVVGLRRILPFLALLVAAGVGQSAESRDFRPRVVINRAFPAITNTPVIAASAAGEQVVRDKDLVLGVTVNGESRAYPINMLTGPRREIINDELGGRAIAATW